MTSIMDTQHKAGDLEVLFVTLKDGTVVTLIDPNIVTAVKEFAAERDEAREERDLYKSKYEVLSQAVTDLGKAARRSKEA